MQKNFKGLPLDFAGFFSLILLTACGSNSTAESSKIPGFPDNDSAPTRRTLKAGDDCGMIGTLAERLADCAQAPDAELGKGWKVLSRVGTETIHFNTLTGISVYEPTQKETKKFPESRDLCQSAQPKGTISGMPAVSAVSRLPWDHQAECEKYASTLRSGQLEAMLTRYYGSCLNLVCGRTHAHCLLKDLNVSCVNVGGFYFMPVAKYTQEMDCR
ncbi:MAG: hypothetical protein H7222_03380 [Methylotenera sp.]|nr:hypothetical protein [Oligoflexia bacterium]